MNKRKRPKPTQDPYPPSFYLQRIPKGFIAISLLLLVSSIISAILLDHDTSPQGWYQAYEYLSFIALVPIIFSYYLFCFTYYLTGGKHKTASLKVIMSGLIINYLTINMAYAWLYMFISKVNPHSFSEAVKWIDGLSISIGIATTIGSSPISPKSVGAQVAVITHELLSFVVAVILIAWVMSQITDKVKSKMPSH